MLKCPVCGKSYLKIDTQHLKKHGLSKEQYLERYPSGPIGACQEAKLNIGRAVKSRGPRSAETKLKISESLKLQEYVMTDARRLATPLRIEGARLANTGAKRPKTKKAIANIKAALTQYYLDNPRGPMDKSSPRYARQMEIIATIAANRTIDGLAKLSSKVNSLSHWAKDISELIYGNKTIRLQCTCAKCGSFIDRSLSTYIKHEYTGSICHTCYPPLNGTSNLEQELAEFLSTLSIPFSQHVKNIIAPLELDFYFPGQQIAVEFNGLYWHSDAAKYPIDRHRTKYLKCRDLGIQLIQIFEDEWIKKPEIVKNQLSTLLGLGKEIDVSGPIAEEITADEASTFLNTYHILGQADKSTYHFGLFSESSLVAVLSILQRQNRGIAEHEIVRYVAHPDVNSISAFSMLLSMCLASKQATTMITAVDLRWAHATNNVFTRYGFQPVKEDINGYWYTDFSDRFKLADGIANTAKQHRIYDAGIAKFRLAIE